LLGILEALVIAQLPQNIQAQVQSLLSTPLDQLLTTRGAPSSQLP
jgi:hypothetical protein